jgi:hypothetical protein
MSLDLNKLENKLDEALSNETSETLTKFLNDKRMTNEKDENVNSINNWSGISSVALPSTFINVCGQNNSMPLINNNKKSMKLYTEQQLTRYLLDEGIMELSDLANNLIPHIELPSDEEIEDASLEENNDDLSPAEEFQRGAKWMRNKIQGGNK